MNTRTLILANLTRQDFEHFSNAKITYTGTAADPRFGNSDPRPWGKHAPYIATYIGELLRAVKAMKWDSFSVEIIAGQWIISKEKCFTLSERAARAVELTAKAMNKAPDEILNELVGQRLGVF